MSRLHWRPDRTFNFGDRLSPILYEWLSGVEPAWVSHDHHEPFLAMVGSFLEIAGPKAVVWGTGIISSAAVPQPRADYRAVRGPETRRRILAAGGSCPEIYGDPVSLLPRFYKPLRRGGDRLGVIPHFRERDLPLYAEIRDPKVVVLDITEEPYRFIDRLVTCEAVLSSSLHGLVAAHAYGIPAGWIQPTDLPIGDGIKFKDYLQGVGLDVPAGDRRPTGPEDLPKLVRSLATLPRADYSAFLGSFPASIK